MAPVTTPPVQLRREMTGVGAALYAAGGLLVVLSGALAGFEGAMPWLLIAAGAAAGLVAVAMLVAARVRPMGVPSLAVLNALGTLLTSVVVVAGGEVGSAVNAVFYVFVAAYAFFYFPRLIAAAELALVAVAYAIALQVLDAPDALAQWVVTIGATTMIAVTISAIGSQLRTALAEQERTVARLREVDVVKAAMLRAVSHEVRTPLACVIGYAQTLDVHGERLTPEGRRELAEAAYRNARRLESLLADLLDVDQLARGVVNLRRVEIELELLVAAVLERVDAGDRPMQVHVDRTVVSLDLARVERALEHLVANAVRHTPAGTPIWIRAERSGDEVVVTVEDAGPGIPDGLKRAAAQPFTQGPASALHHNPGAGLGLALADEIARLHGGTLAVEDRPGGGASVSLRLLAA